MTFLRIKTLKTNITIFSIRALKNKKRYYLNHKSWVEILKLDSKTCLQNDEFEKIWELKPSFKLQMKYHHLFFEKSRFSLDYLKPYNGDKYMNALPEVIQKLYDYVKEREPQINQCTIDWFEHDSCIENHKDIKLIPETSVYSFSFSEADRILIFKPKCRGHINYFSLENNTLTIINYRNQDSHVRFVPNQSNENISKEFQRRINITFRCLV